MDPRLCDGDGGGVDGNRMPGFGTCCAGALPVYAPPPPECEACEKTDVPRQSWTLDRAAPGQLHHRGGCETAGDGGYGAPAWDPLGAGEPWAAGHTGGSVAGSSQGAACRQRAGGPRWVAGPRST